MLVALSHGFQVVSGCGFVSLLQTSAQIEKPGGAEPHKSQPQRTAPNPAKHVKGAGKKPPILRASKNKQTPDTAAVEAKIDEANKTLSTVTDLLSEVNATSAELLGQIDAALTTALEALEQAKSGAAMLGPDVSKTVTEIADKLIAAATKLQLTLQKASTQVESTVEKLSTQITTLAAKVLGNFQSAVDKVNGVGTEPTEAPAAALLETNRNTHQGPFDWIFGGSNKFQTARGAITKANNSVAQLDSMLDSINTTAVGLLTETTLGEATAGLEKVKSTVDMTNIPGPVVGPVNSILSKLDGVVTTASSKVTAAVSTVESGIESARGALPMLYAASDSLMEMVDAAEEASKSA